MRGFQVLCVIGWIGVVEAGAAAEDETAAPATPAPTIIFGRAELDSLGVITLGDALRQLPVQSGTLDQQPGRGGDGTMRADLRGLGAGRTLTLINGRRAAPGGTGADGSADLSLIPLVLVDRIEITLAGGSAVYGSDAIAGVVNIILRSDFDGVTGSLYAGVSPHGDRFTYDASTIGGTTWGHKGSLVISTGYQDQDPVLAQDRAFSRSVPRPLARLDARNIDTNGDGRPDPVNVCGAGVALCTPSVDGGFSPYPTAAQPYAPVGYLDVPSKRYHVSAAGSYELAPGVSAFADASYLHRTSAQQLEPYVLSTLASGIAISAQSEFNPFGGDVHDFVRPLDEFGPRKLVQDVDAFDVVIGLRGELPRSLPAAGGWRWELSYDYGHTSGSEQLGGTIALDRLATALGPSFLDPTGGPRCGTSLTTAVPACVPADLLHLDRVTQGLIDYVAFTGSATGSNTQHTVLATLRGRVLELPDHGEVSAAVGADVRAQSGTFAPDAQIASGDTSAPTPPAASGSFHVLEGFGEVSAVPVTGAPFAERIEIDLAARGYQDSTSGSGAVWSAGGLYRPVAGVALRGTYGTGFHLPSVGERFHAAITGIVAAEDPCDSRPPSKPVQTPLDPMVAARCAQQMVPASSVFGTSQLRTATPGNPDLAPETSTTRTAGVVLDPPWIPGLSLSLDYWRVDLDRLAQQPVLLDILSRCYQQGDASACARVHRDPAQGYRIAFVDLADVSTGSASSSGVDVGALYHRTVAGVGRFDEQLHVQHLLDPSTAPAGSTAVDLGTRPGYMASWSSVWSHPIGLGAALDVRYLGRVPQCPQGVCLATTTTGDAAAWYEVDLQGSYAFDTPVGRFTLAAGVHNLLDRDPPILYLGGQGDPFGSNYDLTGRLIYLRAGRQY